MVAMESAGVIRNASRKNGAVRDVRRMAALERAADMVGGQAALAEALGIEPRRLREKISAERPIHDDDLRLAAGALSVRASAAADLAMRLSALLPESAQPAAPSDEASRS